MATETKVLADAEIFGIFDTCSDLPLHYDPDEIYAMGRAIEQAVLNSPEIQELRKDAGRWRKAVETWRISKVEVFRGGTLTHPQSIPWETLTYQVDAAMEAQI